MTTTVNSSPIFAKRGIFNTGKIITTMNTAKDGTGTVVTVFDPQRSVSSLTSSGTTATVTTSLPHGFLNGEEILINGASPAGYNGIKTITVTSPTGFTYTVDSGLSTPATGTITADPINGQRISKIVFQPTGAATASVGRAFLNNGLTNATATNNSLLKDVSLPQVTSTLETATMPVVEMLLDIVVPPFHKINLTIGTTVANEYSVYAVAGGY